MYNKKLKTFAMNSAHHKKNYIFYFIRRIKIRIFNDEFFYLRQESCHLQKVSIIKCNFK